MSDSDWREIRDENDLREWFFDCFTENLLQFVRELTAAGVSDECINRQVLPECTKLYHEGRAKALQDYRRARAIRQDGPSAALH